MEEANDPDIIAENDLGEMRRCDCGGVNLVLGPVTLHFAAEEVEMLDQLGRAGRAHCVRRGTARPNRRDRNKVPRLVH